MATYSFINNPNPRQQIVRGEQPNRFAPRDIDLQQVTDNGNTTTNTIEVAGLDVGTSTHTAVEGEAYFEDTDIVMVGGNIKTDGSLVSTNAPTFTYTSGNLTNITYSNTLEKDITYNPDGTVDELVITMPDSSVITKSFVWSSGVLQSIIIT